MWFQYGLLTTIGIIAVMVLTAAISMVAPYVSVIIVLAVTVKLILMKFEEDKKNKKP